MESLNYYFHMLFLQLSFSFISSWGELNIKLNSNSSFYESILESNANRVIEWKSPHKTFSSFSISSLDNYNKYQTHFTPQKNKRLGGNFNQESIRPVGTSNKNKCRTKNECLKQELLPKIQKREAMLCPIGYFTCSESKDQCVHQLSICNSISDCEDGSDEENCGNEHEKRFWDAIFPARPEKDSELDIDVSENEHLCKYENYQSLKNLNISQNKDDNKINDIIYNNDFEMEENKCVCIWEKLICTNLEANNLSIVHHNVEYLDLSGSLITNLDFNSEPSFPYLENLILTSCSISEISYGAFYMLHSLRSLHLTGNNLRVLLDFSFFTNIKLERLLLGYNMISEIKENAFHNLTNLKELDLRHNKITGKDKNIFSPLQNLKILHLSNNKIKVLDEKFLNGLNNLELLSLSGNMISNIEPNTFSKLIHLKTLYLSWNKITALRSKVFCNLSSLLDLHLNENLLISFDVDSFECLESLEYLDIRKNSFEDLKSPESIFKNLTALQFIYFDEFWMCAWTPHVRICEPKGDGISSIENLLDNIALRICVWIMGVIGIFGNISVVISRVLLHEPNPIHSFYIKNLALGDLLMGIFLISIGIHDLKFRGKFITYQHQWRHSLTCKISGLICTWSSEASVLILALITLDRYLSIVRPFGRKNSSKLLALLLILSLWLISFLIAYLPLSPLFYSYFQQFYSSNGLCLPLQIHNPYSAGWEYSTSIFVLLNSSIFLLILFAYAKMLTTIRSSALMLRSNQEKQDGVLAKRFSLIVFTDFVSWAPVILSKIVAMSGVEVQEDLYAWLAVFVLPVNSMLNPIIYTLTTKLFRQKIYKLRDRWRKWGRRATHRGTSEESSVSLSLFSRARVQRHTVTTNVFGSHLAASRANSNRSNNLRV